MKIVNFDDIENKTAAFLILKELRHHLSETSFQRLYLESKSDGYKLVVYMNQEMPLAVMGYRITHDFTHGKSLYIDDLVTSSKKRSKGLGNEMIEYATTIAEQEHCEMIRLCSGIDREDAHRFYKRAGFLSKSIVFKKPLNT